MRIQSQALGAGRSERVPQARSIGLRTLKHLFELTQARLVGPIPRHLKIKMSNYARNRGKSARAA